MTLQGSALSPRGSALRGEPPSSRIAGSASGARSEPKASGAHRQQAERAASRRPAELIASKRSAQRAEGERSSSSRPAAQALHLRAHLRRVLRGLEDAVGGLAEEDEAHLLERRRAREVGARLLEQDLGAALDREAPDPRADRGDRDRAAAALGSELEAAAHARAHA